MIQPDHERPRMREGPEKAYFFVLPEKRTKSEFPFVYDVEWRKDNPYECPDGHWIFQGAVSWPIVVPDEGLVGIAVLGGFHLETREVWLLSERKFIVVDGGGKYPDDAPRPLKTWFEWCYDQFVCRRFYHLQPTGRGKEAPKTSTKKFTGQIHRTFGGGVGPSPTLFGLDLDFQTSMQTVYEYVALEKFRHPEESRLWTEMRAYDANPDAAYPALHSACVLLNGLDRRLNREYLIRKVLSEFSENEHGE